MNTRFLLLFILLSISQAFAQRPLIEQPLEKQGKKSWDRFGQSIALENNRALVGMIGAAGSKLNNMYYYEFNGTYWVLKQAFKAQKTALASVASFGISCSLSGNTLVVGDDRGGDGYTGSAYVFEFENNQWVEKQELVGSNIEPWCGFGVRVAIQGNTLVIGATAQGNKGAVYVYEKENGTWVEKQILSASDGKAEDSFGWRVALSNNVIVVGSANSDAKGENSGQAYVYEKGVNGWTETVKLLPADVKANDKFGINVAIDNNILAVSGGETSGGAVYPYYKKNNSWVPLKKITNANLGASIFGSSIDITNGKAIIGSFMAYNNSGVNTGAAYVYEISDTTFTYERKLLPADGKSGDSFSSAVATDGESFMISATETDSATVSSCGRVYFYSDICKNLLVKNVTANICSGDEYLFNGELLSKTGIYTDSLKSVWGCDSIVVLNLTIHNPVTVDENIAICNGENYNGYTEAGTYVRNLKSVWGCDSVVTTTLVVNQPVSFEEEITICEGQRYKGWSKTGTYTRKLNAANGCDSIVTTILTVLPLPRSDEYVTICNGEVYNGWTKTGKYTRRIPTEKCDSVVTTYLTVNQSYRISKNITICKGESYGEWDEPGIYVQFNKTEEGCDSIVETHLFIYEADTAFATVEICEGENYLGYSEAGEYTLNLKSVSGCDSIVNLMLVINQKQHTQEVVTICEGDNYQGWTKSGEYTRNYTSQFNCDSIITTTLVVEPLKQSMEYIEICEGENYKGWDKTGEYSTRYETNGCDSLVTTQLTVHNTQKTFEEITICEGSYYLQWDSTGTYFRTLESQFGCDSIIETHLVVNKAISTQHDVVICKGEKYKEWSEEGTYIEKFVSQTGCDSIVTTNLKITALDKTVISQNGNTLSTNMYDTYQWYLNDTPINGAVNANYTAIESGTYSVQAEVNGCLAALSDKLVLILTSTNQLVKMLSIYPNPATNEIVISGLPLIGNTTITVVNVLGQSQLKTETTLDQIKLDVSGLKRGSYIVTLEGSVNQTLQFIKN